jgi:subtilisin family serine protease
MISRGRGVGFRLARAVALLALLFVFVPLAFSKTIVKKTGECAREVTVNIQLYSGGFQWTDEYLDKLPADDRARLRKLMDNYSSYSQADLQAIAGEWKGEVEHFWNGPTREQVQNAAEKLGYSEADLNKAVKGDLKLRDEIAAKVEDYLKQGGGGNTSCAEVNCCQITFKVNVKTRAYSDAPDPDYHQIQVMKKGWRSSVTTSDKGLHGNQQGTTGRWSYEPGNPMDASAMHETGHLMGLEDGYEEKNGICSTKEGHEDDIMDDSYGFPVEDAIHEILTAAGLDCDCCPKNRSDEFYQRYGRTYFIGEDAITTTNCEILKQLEQDYLAQLGNVTAANLPVTAKADLITKISTMLAKVRAALKNCPKETASTTGTTTGFTGETIPFTVDPRICWKYVEGDYLMTPVEPQPGTGQPTAPGFVPVNPPAGTPENPPGGGVKPPIVPLTPEDVPPGGGPSLPPEFFTPGQTPVNPSPETSTPAGGPDTVVKRPESGTPAPKTPTIPIEIVPMSVPSGAPPTVVAPPPDTRPPAETAPPPTSQTKPPVYYYFTVYVVKAEEQVLEGGTTVTKPAEGVVAKLGFPPPPLPRVAERTDDATNRDHDKEPRQAVTDENGFGTIFSDGFESGDTSAWSQVMPGEGAPKSIPATGAKVDVTPNTRKIVYLSNGQPAKAIGEDPFGGTPAKPPETGQGDPTGGKTALPQNLEPLVADKITFGNVTGNILVYPLSEEQWVAQQLGGYWVQIDPCREVEETDPYYASKGSWGQPYDDQWAIKRIGYTAGPDSAWAAAGTKLSPVVVAVIDTGLDWNHADISWDNIWQNPGEIPGNRIDDDGNGYVDDLIGWDFISNTNQPWDQDGHGTFVAGIIAAAKDNGIGIAGINPAAKIMVVKAMNDFGNGFASKIARAIKYAADNGARVINLSVGGDGLTALEQMAVAYAHAKGAVVVVAAGNKGTATANFGLAPYPEVIAVGATDANDVRPVFSNYGPEVDIAAPGMDVLSLRARRTDFMRDIRGVRYRAGEAYIGADKRYYRSSGTSFSTPMVAGTASLMLAKNPALTPDQVKRMLLNSARDIEIPGIDQFTGYGLLDAAAALKADPAFEIVADISGIEVVEAEGGGLAVAVNGTAGADRFARANVYIGQGENPASFKAVAALKAPVEAGRLALIPAGEFRTAPVWTIRLVVTHANGKTREQWFTLTLG